jgi:hypothetical protein
MGIKDFVKGVTGRFTYNPKALIASGDTDDAYNISTEEIKRVPDEDLEKAFIRCPPVFTGLNLFSAAIFGKGFTVQSDDKKARKLCEDALNVETFKPTAMQATLHSLLYGRGFQEIMWDENGKGKNIAGFGIADPKTMKIKNDKYGRITKFVQKVNNSEIEFKIFDAASQKKYPTPQFAYYRFFRVADSINGIGIVEPIMKDINTYMDMKESVREAIEKFANPLLWVQKIGAKNKQEIEDINEQFKGINRKSFIGTSDKYLLSLVESARGLPQLRSHYDLIIDSMVAGLRTPKAFLFGKGENSVVGTTMNAFMSYSMFELSLLQEKLSDTWENQIFIPLCQRNGISANIPSVVWNPMLDTDETVKYQNIQLQINAIKTAKDAQLIDDATAKKMTTKLIEKWNGI